MLINLGDGHEMSDVEAAFPVAAIFVVWISMAAVLGWNAVLLGTNCF